MPTVDSALSLDHGSDNNYSTFLFSLPSAANKSKFAESIYFDPFYPQNRRFMIERFLMFIAGILKNNIIFRRFSMDKRFPINIKTAGRRFCAKSFSIFLKNGYNLRVKNLFRTFR
jgi:hypothetical protein